MDTDTNVRHLAGAGEIHEPATKQRCSACLSPLERKVRSRGSTILIRRPDGLQACSLIALGPSRGEKWLNQGPKKGALKHHLKNDSQQEKLGSRGQQTT